MSLAIERIECGIMVDTTSDPSPVLWNFPNQTCIFSESLEAIWGRQKGEPKKGEADELPSFKDRRCVE